MALATGMKLGPYELIGTIGAGGMGEVYRARDTRLGRDVAIKVLPQSFARDPERLLRFEQEARVVAALEAPNVVSIYDVGTHEGQPYLVSEFIDGESLREKFAGGPLPIRRAVEYALGIAHGLAAAHDRGIVHRDLKPENILVSRNGWVKIVDFGLAKFDAPESTATASLAATAAVTKPGLVMGTVGYMSPEQVRGSAVDHRTDIFSLGAILYEMLSGKRAFQGASAVETMNAVLKEDPPDWTPTALQASPGLERIVRHCLEKDPADRFQSAHDLTFALGALSGSESTAPMQAATLHRRRWLPWALAACALLLSAVLAGILLTRGSAAEPQHFAIIVPGEVRHVALSADGRMLAFVSRDDLSGADMVFVQQVGSPEARLLAGTEGASYPFWSPDDAWVAFFAEGKLKKVALAGGLPQPLVPVGAARGGSWGTRNVIIFTADAGGMLSRVNADGTGAGLLGETVPANASSHRWPVMLPDGEHFLYWGGDFNEADLGDNGVYFGSLHDKSARLLVRTRSNAAFAGNSLLYVDERGSLQQVSFDPGAGKLSGEPHPLAAHVAYSPSTYFGEFAAANGTVVYSTSNARQLSVLTWFDRNGKELGHVGDPSIVANPNISPDGTRVVADVNDLKARSVNLWIDNLRAGTTTHFTFSSSEDADGLWSRDGASIVYRSAGLPGIVLKKASGLEPEKPLRKIGFSDDLLPNSWSADGRQVLCTYQSGRGGSQLVLVSLTDGKLTPFTSPKASETNGQISPDGRWVAYAANESGDWEIYVTTFPGAAGKWQVSRGGGTEPRWSASGKEIYYLAPKGMLTAVPVSADGGFSTGVPQQLFPVRSRAPISSTDLYTYDVAKDGRFLVNRYVKPDYAPPLSIVLNAK